MANLDGAGKMHHGNRCVFRKDLVEARAVANIALFELAPPHEFPMSVGEVIENNRSISSCRQLHARMGPDVSGTTDDKNVFAFQ